MKHITLLFVACFFVGIIATPIEKSKSVPVDEVELMLQKISQNLEMASVATAQAKAMGEKMVAEKVEEKAQLKEAVAIAENKVDAMTKKVEVFSAKMIGAGIDTSEAPLKLSGKTYDAWLNYVEEGGKEDFEYFRLYIYN
jgi:hypothetical protein